MLRTIGQGVLILVLATLALLFLPAAAPLEATARATVHDVWQAVRMPVYIVLGAVVLVFVSGMLKRATWIYPDKYGQWPIWGWYLYRHPELTIQANQAHQKVRIVKASNPLSNVTHYAPKFGNTTADAPLLAETPPQLPSAPPFSQLLQSWRPSMQQMLLGYDLNGPVYGNIDDLLSTGVAGRPGTGKSTAQRFIMAQAYAAGARLAIIDPHGSLIDLAPRDMVEIRAETPAEYDRAAAEIEEEIEVRLDAWHQRQRDFDPFLILVDELPLLAEDHPSVIRALKRVVLEARKFRMYALISGQGLPAKYFGDSVVRDGLSTKYIFWTTAAQARMAGLEDTQVAKELLATLQHDPKGRAILARSSTDPKIVAIPNTTSADLEAVRCPVLVDGNTNIPKHPELSRKRMGMRVERVLAILATLPSASQKHPKLTLRAILPILPNMIVYG